METISPTISPRPALSSWLIGMSSLAVLAFFAVAVLSIGKSLRERALFEKVSERLKFKEYSQSEQLIEQIASPPRLLRTASLIVPDEILELRQHDIQAAKTLLSVASALSVNRIDEAQRRLSALSANTAQQIAKDIPTGIAELVDTEQRLTTQQRLVTSSEDAIKSAVKQGSLVADEFGELLGLPAEHASVDDVGLPSYEHGVLEGLPRIRGLRDHIADLTFLKVELEGLHANLKSSANTYESFSERLRIIKNSYAEINSKFVDAATQYDAAQEAVVTLGRELASLRNRLQTELSSRILELLKTSTP